MRCGTQSESELVHCTLEVRIRDGCICGAIVNDNFIVSMKSVRCLQMLKKKSIISRDINTQVIRKR